MGTSDHRAVRSRRESSERVLFTPFTIDLLPGRYRLECENCGVNAQVTFDLDVTGEALPSFTRTMPGFDPRRAVDGLIGRNE